MPRRREIAKREVPADPIYDSPLVTKFIRTIMKDGKRSTAEKIMYGALNIVKDKTQDDPLKVFKKAVDNVKPALEVKSRRVGGSNYQVPIEVNPTRRLSLSLRWICHRPWRRQDDAGEVGQRIHGCRKSAGWSRQEARRRAPHGRSQQGIRALPLLRPGNHGENSTPRALSQHRHHGPH